MVISSYKEFLISPKDFHFDHQSMQPQQQQHMFSSTLRGRLLETSEKFTIYNNIKLHATNNNVKNYKYHH